VHAVWVEQVKQLFGHDWHAPETRTTRAVVEHAVHSVEAPEPIHVTQFAEHARHAPEARAKGVAVEHAVHAVAVHVTQFAEHCAHVLPLAASRKYELLQAVHVLVEAGHVLQFVSLH